MTSTNAKYLVNGKGKKTAVLLNIKEYSRLLERLEELQDSLDLDEAVRNAGEFRDYREIRKELLKEERL